MEWRSSEFRKSRDVPAIINDFDRFSTHMFMEEVGAIRPRTKLQKCTESGRRLGYNSNILPLHAQHFCAFVKRLWTFPCHGGIAEDPSRSVNAWNLQWLSTFPAPRGSSEDHSMLCNAWILQYMISIFLSLQEVWGPLDVDPTVEFAIAYQHFLLLGGAPMTTRRRATHGIYNTLLTFPCSRGKSEHRSMSIKPLILQ